MTTLLEWSERQIATPTCDRNTSPSEAGMLEHEARGAAQTNRERTLAAVKRWPNCTSSELADHCGMFDVELRKRLVDLEDYGLVRKGPQRKCGIKNRAMYVWEATCLT